MTSSRGVAFPTSMVDYLTNPVDISFGSMTMKSTTPAACLINENTAATSF
jgi:hypothetical protein